MASMGGPPLGSPGLLQHPRGGGSMSRGQGMGPPYGGRHFLPGKISLSANASWTHDSYTLLMTAILV